MGLFNGIVLFEAGQKWFAIIIQMWIHNELILSVIIILTEFIALPYICANIVVEGINGYHSTIMHNINNQVICQYQILFNS